MIDDLEDYIKPTLKKKSNKIIIHAGTNNLKKDNPKEVMKKFEKLITGVKSDHPNVDITLSSIIKRSDNKDLNQKIHKVNELLKSYCEVNNFGFINNDNIPEQFLNSGGLHLNHRGIQALVSNFRSYINY